jgi:hypothetical protein
LTGSGPTPCGHATRPPRLYQKSIANAARCPAARKTPPRSARLSNHPGTAVSHAPDPLPPDRMIPPDRATPRAALPLLLSRTGPPCFPHIR